MSRNFIKFLTNSFTVSQKKAERRDDMMSQQHKRWNSLVEEALEKRGWSRSDLATVVGVSPATITQLFKEGKGSDDLKLRINKKLRINESWEKFED